MSDDDQLTFATMMYFMTGATLDGHGYHYGIFMVGKMGKRRIFVCYACLSSQQWLTTTTLMRTTFGDCPFQVIVFSIGVSVAQLFRLVAAVVSTLTSVRWNGWLSSSPPT